MLDRLAADQAQGVVDAEQAEIIQDCLNSAEPDDIEEGWFRLQVAYNASDAPASGSHSGFHTPLGPFQIQLCYILFCLALGALGTPQTEPDEEKWEEVTTTKVQTLLAVGTCVSITIWDLSPLLEPPQPTCTRDKLPVKSNNPAPEAPETESPTPSAQAEAGPLSTPTLTDQKGAEGQDQDTEGQVKPERKRRPRSKSRSAGAGAAGGRSKASNRKSQVSWCG